jgi:Fic family protein
LQDKEGQPVKFGMPDLVSSEDRDRYLVSSLIEEAITSSQLEGAATTREVAKEMLRSGRSPQDRNERMILNNFHVMQRIRELRNEPLTPELILVMHQIVSKGTLDEPGAAGRLRRANEKNSVMDATPPRWPMP